MNPTATPRSTGWRLWRWAWLLTAVALCTLALLAALGLVVWQELAGWGGPGVNVTINGQGMAGGWNFADWPPAHKVVLVAVLALAALAAVLIVPVALVVVAVVVTLLVTVVTVVSVALPVLLTLLITGLLLSPLLLVGWWWWRRHRRSTRASGPMTIDA
jgi:hypothetical protein